MLFTNPLLAIPAAVVITLATYFSVNKSDSGTPANLTQN